MEFIFLKNPIFFASKHALSSNFVQVRLVKYCKGKEKEFLFEVGQDLSIFSVCVILLDGAGFGAGATLKFRLRLHAKKSGS